MKRRDFLKLSGSVCLLAPFSSCREVSRELPSDITITRIIGFDLYCRRNKVAGKNAYTFFFISAQNRKITAYHIDDSRDTLPATIAMNEAARTAKPGQKLAFITDGNPSYPAGLHFLNSKRKPENRIEHRKVIGLQNLDEESELNRHFKQIVERLNRTYKYHIRAANGFKINNGAVCLTTLFVTHYNFLRPHMALEYKVPVHVKELDGPLKLQNKWCRILNMAAKITDSMLPA